MYPTLCVKIPGTRSQLCWAACQQPQGGTQSRTNSCLQPHQKTAVVPQRSREGHPCFKQIPKRPLLDIVTFCALPCSSLLICFAGELVQQDWREGRASRGRYQGEEGAQTWHNSKARWTAAATTEVLASPVVPSTSWKRKAGCWCFWKLCLGKSWFQTEIVSVQISWPWQ